jgi:hypothetical protein
MNNRDSWVSIFLNDMRNEYDPNAKDEQIRRRRQEKERSKISRRQKTTIKKRNMDHLNPTIMIVMI